MPQAFSPHSKDRDPHARRPRRRAPRALPPRPKDRPPRPRILHRQHPQQERVAAWCDPRGIKSLDLIEPVHVAAYVEDLQGRIAPPSVKLRLAALRMLFDWLVIGQVIPMNPASSVRGPKHSVKKGKTPVLAAEEARQLLDAIDTASVVGLRDRALIALLTYTFARVGAAVNMRVEDIYTQGRRTWARLHEKGGKRHEMPCHHKLESYLEEYVERAGIAGNAKAFLFRTTEGQSGYLTERPMTRNDAHRMIRRRAAAAGIRTKIGCHSFRATGITEYLKNGGKLDVAQQMANHESARTTGLYDRRNGQVSLDEIERILNFGSNQQVACRNERIFIRKTFGSCLSLNYGFR